MEVNKAMIDWSMALLTLQAVIAGFGLGDVILCAFADLYYDFSFLSFLIVISH